MISPTTPAHHSHHSTHPLISPPPGRLCSLFYRNFVAALPLFFPSILAFIIVVGSFFATRTRWVIAAWVLAVFLNWCTIQILLAFKGIGEAWSGHTSDAPIWLYLGLFGSVILSVPMFIRVGISLINSKPYE